MAKKVISTNDELPSNSIASHTKPMRETRHVAVETEIKSRVEESRPPVRVVATRRKKTLAQSLASMITGPETKNIVSYVLNDVLVPAFKSTIQEMAQSFVDMVLYGESKRGSRSSGRDQGRSTISYDRLYRGRERDEPKTYGRASRANNFDLDEIYFRDHSDAEDVLEAMSEHLERFEVISVADFFEMAGIKGATWVHHKWGWDNLKKAFLTHTRHGYAIVLPDPSELE